MDMNDYQKEARKTAIYPKKHMVVYPALGLAGEAGEVCETVKKTIRGDFAINRYKIFDVVKYPEEIAKELGDVLWYLAALASDLNLSLADIAEGNISKLKDRAERNKIKGEGDER